MINRFQQLEHNQNLFPLLHFIDIDAIINWKSLSDIEKNLFINSCILKIHILNLFSKEEKHDKGT